MKEINQNLLFVKLLEEFELGGQVKVRHGSSVRMKCPASGIPPPEIQWMFNDKRTSEVRHSFLEIQWMFNDKRTSEVRERK